MPPTAEDQRWMAAAVALAERARPMASPNPGVGAIVVKDGRVVGRGWTQQGGRPHAEAMALNMAGDAARGADIYVTLEPCAHQSQRGPACADLAASAGLARAIIGMRDPDPRTAGKGMARLGEAGVAVINLDLPAAKLGLSGHEAWRKFNRPHITLKLALSLDGCIATAGGESQWITGEEARAHTHRERARADAILVGGGTLRADNPSLNVRLPGLENRSPRRFVLTSGDAPEGWSRIGSPSALEPLGDARYLFVEGGAGVATAFLELDMVDRLMIYRAPILIGNGRPGIGAPVIAALGEAHGRWRREDDRRFGPDTLEIFLRKR